MNVHEACVELQKTIEQISDAGMRNDHICQVIAHVLGSFIATAPMKHQDELVNRCISAVFASREKHNNLPLIH